MNKEQYRLGTIHLSNPLILASSPATEYEKHLLECANAGAAAAILKSCFTVNTSIDNYKERQFCLTNRGMWGNSSIGRELLDPIKAMILFNRVHDKSVMLVIPSIAGFSLDPQPWAETIALFEPLQPLCIQLDLFYIPCEFALPETLEKIAILLKTLASMTKISLYPKLNNDIRPAVAWEFLHNTGIGGWSLLDSMRLCFPIRQDNQHTIPFNQFQKKVETASLFGAWQFPITCDYTYQIKAKSNLPIIAGGGVTNAHDIKTLLLLGADAVQVATSVISGGAKWIKNTLEDLKREEESTIDLPEPQDQRYVARVNEDICLGCGKCAEHLMCVAVNMIEEKAHIKELKCSGCGYCLSVCATKAINLEKKQY